MTDGKIKIVDGTLMTPDKPIIPFIEGDGTGPDIWRAAQRVFDEAVKKAILQWKFTPAIGTDQKAHESIIGMTITLPKQAVKAK